MILTDFFEEHTKEVYTHNYVIKHRSYDFLLSYDWYENTWYLDCITECFKPNFEYSINEFVGFVKSESIEIDKEISKKWIMEKKG